MKIAFTCFLLALSAQAASDRLFDQKRISHEVISFGDFIAIPNDAKDVYNFINYKTGQEVSWVASDAPFPGHIFSAPNGDLIGVNLYGNLATLMDPVTLTKKGTLELGGYTDIEGNFEPYWMIGGCAMDNGDLYFVSSSDVALVRVRAGTTKWELVADQDSSGLSGSSEVACANNRLIIANHRSVMDPTDDELLVLSLEGKVVEKVKVPGLMHVNRFQNTLVVTQAPAAGKPGLVQFADLTLPSIEWKENNTSVDYPQMVAFDKTKNTFLVTNKYPSEYVEFDATSYKLLSRTKFSMPDADAKPRGIAISDDGQSLFIESEGTVSRVSR